jgi:hypothetical protein
MLQKRIMLAKLRTKLGDRKEPVSFTIYRANTANFCCELQDHLSGQMGVETPQPEVLRRMDGEQISGCFISLLGAAKNIFQSRLL